MSLTSLPRVLLGSLLLALSLLATGCSGGNPTCIFVGGCGGGTTPGGGGVSGNPAVLPEDGQWILDVPPSVSDVFPTGNQVAGSTPVVLFFTESMNENTLLDAFEIVPVGGNIIGDPIANVQQVLLAGGRVLVLLPATSLAAGAYIVRVAQPTATGSSNPFGGGGTLVTAESPTDLTGQELDQALGQQVGSTFTVTSSPPSAPRVVTTFPPNAATGTSDMPQVVVVFDRDMAATSVDDDSFQVTVDGNDPVPDPLPELLSLSGLPEPRVLLWQSESAGGVPVSLGADMRVEVNLSPSGDRLLDTTGAELAATTVSFTTIPFTTPLGAGLLSEPTDAIGIRNLTVDGDEDLAIQVDLLDSEPGDLLDLYLVGTDKSETDPQLMALRREVRLTGTAPIQVQIVGATDADLTLGGNPENPRFADGSVSFAFRLRRGSVVSPLRLLDVDLATGGVQDPFLDTTRPTLTRLSIPSGAVGSGVGSTDLVSDLGDLVVSGVADEILESVEVTAVEGARSLGNGVLPSVVGSRDDGAFLAAPVGLGVFGTGSASFSAVGYDRAFNASNVVTGTYIQRGAVGPTPFVPGAVLDVDVFDALTLAPLPGALVMVHADKGDGVTFPLTSAARTNTLGEIRLSTDSVAVGAVLTVDLAGYDLFTFHGVTATRVSVPLRRTGTGASSFVGGSLTSEDAAISSILGGLDRLVDDSRLPFGTRRTYPTDDCFSFFSFLCSYGPQAIVAERLGVQSFFAGDFTATETTFNANQLLQAFCLEIPTGPVPPGATEDTSFELPFLLSDSSVDPAERPDELTAFTYRADTTTGIDTTTLANANPDATGLPQVSVETLVPGVHATVAVGMGLAFDQGGDVWNVRSARPGAVSPMGFFGERSAVDPDLFVRVEVRDGDENVSGVRPRLSTLVAPFDLTSPDVPRLLAPAMGAMTTGRAFGLRFADTLPDGSGQVGLYRARLTGSNGREWILWGVDRTGGADVVLRAPDPREAGGVGLADGMVSCELASYAWPTLDPLEFLWSDVEREYDLFARSEAFSFIQAP